MGRHLFADTWLFHFIQRIPSFLGDLSAAPIIGGAGAARSQGSQAVSRLFFVQGEGTTVILSADFIFER